MYREDAEYDRKQKEYDENLRRKDTPNRDHVYDVMQPHQGVLKRDKGKSYDNGHSSYQDLYSYNKF